MHESLRRSSLGEVAAGGRVNLELALRADDRLGGHIVQGHVDGVGVVRRRPRRRASPASSRSRPTPTSCATSSRRGRSPSTACRLTVVAVDDASFDVSLIPETLERTSLGSRRAGHARQPGGRPPGQVRREAVRSPHLSMSTRATTQFATVEEALEDIAAGRMVVVVDDEDRENEGDLVMAAEFVTPDGDQLHGHPRARLDLPGAHARALRRARPRAHGAEERDGAPDAVHRDDRGPRGRDHRHQRGRPRAHDPRRGRPGQGPGRHRRGRPRQPAQGRAPAASWSAPGTPRRRSTWRGWPGCSRRA